MDSKTLKALKNLAVKITGKTLAEVKGDTVDEVIQFIADNYPTSAG